MVTHKNCKWFNKILYYKTFSKKMFLIIYIPIYKKPKKFSFKEISEKSRKIMEAL